MQLIVRDSREDENMRLKLRSRLLESLLDLVLLLNYRSAFSYDIRSLHVVTEALSTIRLLQGIP